jgi:DNA-directed RNA polymerase subunit M/transcription elongation factor TFIIS
MSNISFFCAVCGQALSVDAAFAGEVAECTRCTRWVPVPGFPGKPPLSGCTSVYPPDILYMDVIFFCPGCERRLKVDARWEGRSLECPKCTRTVTVPWWSRRAKTAAPESRAVGQPVLSSAEIDFLSSELSLAES